MVICVCLCNQLLQLFVSHHKAPCCKSLRTISSTSSTFSCAWAPQREAFLLRARAIRCLLLQQCRHNMQHEVSAPITAAWRGIIWAFLIPADPPANAELRGNLRELQGVQIRRKEGKHLLRRAGRHLRTSSTMKKSRFWVYIREQKSVIPLRAAQLS